MEAIIRFGVFLGIFLTMAAWELYRPKRRLSLTRRRRWPINLGLAALNVGAMRFSIGAAAWWAANWAAEQQIGLFNALPIVPRWLSIALSLLLLDLAIYAQHVAAHRWRWFWRLHQVHHSDLDFDTTTAVRFHPLEIMVSMLYKVVLVVLLGVAPATVIAFEVILNGCALFNHGNVGLAWCERWLRAVLVTPDMHRIHHSAFQQETDSNYGFSLSCWDRLFKTYCAQPQQSQAEMVIGLREFRDDAELGFLGLLALPFRHLRGR